MPFVLVNHPQFLLIGGYDPLEPMLQERLSVDRLGLLRLLKLERLSFALIVHVRLLKRIESFEIFLPFRCISRPDLQNFLSKLLGPFLLLFD